jgi:3-phytase
MKIIGIPVLISSFFLLNSCRQNTNDERSVKRSENFITVDALVETDPVPGKAGIDAADDPAFWENSGDPGASLVFATNKKGGIVVYNLEGDLIKYYPSGLPNNIDIRKNVMVGDTTIDIAGFSNREGNVADICLITDSGELVFPELLRISPAFKGEIYGFCFFSDITSGLTYAVINSKDGDIELWSILSADSSLNAILSKSFKVPSQPEGMVADDEEGFLYAGEEDKGIWKFDLKKNAGFEPFILNEGRIKNNKALRADIEGLAIYYGTQGKGYLLVSSQGNNSYAVFNRTGNNEYLGSFRIMGPDGDYTQETDGIDVTNCYSGDLFKKGLLIVQDGLNINKNNQEEPQNFKLVSWEKIEDALILR